MTPVTGTITPAFLLAAEASARREDKVLWWAKLGWRLQLQHLPRPGGVVALSGMPQTEVADLVEAARQHVLEEAAHELVAAEAAGSPAAGLAVLVLDGDRFVVEADDAGVGESDAKDVAGEVVEHGLFAVAPGGDVEDPVAVRHTASGMTRSGHFRCSSARNLPRTSLARALMGSRNVRRAGCQVLPSSEMPPPLTRQWTCGCKISCWVQVCSTASTPTVPPT